MPSSSSSSSSVQTSRRHRPPSLQTNIVLVAAVAIAVAVHSTIAVPQLAINSLLENADSDTITNVPNCECVYFHLCYNEDAINVPEGRCDADLVCCLKEPQTCGTSDLTLSNQRIMETPASTSTYLGQFPWMAMILVEKTNLFVCGGSIIHPRVILTAAHCVSGKDMKLMKVRVGVWNAGSKSTNDHNIMNIFSHPNYTNEAYLNDIALIELKDNIVINQYVNVICIPTDEININYDSQACVSTGWGKNAFGRNASFHAVLKKIDLSIVSNDKCQEQLRETRLSKYFQLHNSFVCAGGQEGEDMCTGDGGGPLICELRESLPGRKQYIQLGVVSWGIGCGTKNVPGVYSSTRFNSKWINEKLNTIITMKM